MAIKIKFDSANMPEQPTFVLAYKNGKRIGQLEPENIILKDSLMNPSELSFKVQHYLDDTLNVYWNYIKDFRLLWCKESDVWFEIYVDTNESNEMIKTVTAKQLAQAELGQIKVYNVEINTENDIAREDYVLPTVFYRSDHPEASLIHRIMEKAPHYKIRHVDYTLQNIQRTFTFDNLAIPDVFAQIAKEIGCLVVYHSGTDKYGMIESEVSFYDLQSNCMNPECHHRGEFTSVCPKCGSTDIHEGYGEDTTIFVTADELADNLTLTNNRDALKNCFKLEAGDDLMTATIRNCNPNGSDYIWRISDDQKEEMSEDLKKKIEQYDSEYQRCMNEYMVDSALYNDYRALIKKYIDYPNVENITFPIYGYPALMEAIYHTIDMQLFLESGLMPVVEVSDTNAQIEAMRLTSENLSPVAVADIGKVSLATANNAVLSMAKTIIDPRYQVKIENSALDELKWRGSFIVTNYSDEEDTFTTSFVDVLINEDYTEFIEQKINKLLREEEPKDYSLTGLFKLNEHEFSTELEKYALNILVSLRDMAQTCINFLIEQGIANNESWGKDMYNELYIPRFNQLTEIEKEIAIRQAEIDLIVGKYNTEGELVQEGFQTFLLDRRTMIQNQLNFEKYLGSDLWLEFCSFRRDDKYQNQNFVSDGLNNAELFDKATEFFDIANEEIYKSSELQHSITATLKNLLVIPKFKVLVDKFQVGNWIRVLIDKSIYKLRLLSYEINYDDISKLNVEFSNVMKTADGMADQQDIVAKMVSVTTSYGVTQRQACQGAESNAQIGKWIANGLDATTTKIVNSSKNQTQEWGSHGMLFREYDSDLELYNDEQLKIVNSTIAITDDNWKTTVTALGKFYYTDPSDQTLKTAYGLNSEALVGKIILGENLGVYTSNGKLTFNESGLNVTNGVNSVIINPNDDSVIRVLGDGGESLLSFETGGSLAIKGKIIATGIEFMDGVMIPTDKIDTLHSVAVSGNYHELENIPDFKAVATSGSYNDLIDVPEVHTMISNENTSEPVSGSAVYSFALSDSKTYDVSRVLATDASGKLVWLTTAQLKSRLGITS